MTPLSRVARRLCLFGSTALLALPMFGAETSPKIIDDTSAYFEVLRSQFNADKVATISGLLKLTAAEADKFWPIYREYEKNHAALGDRKLELVREFFKEFSSAGLTEESSRTLAEKWLKNLETRTDLWKKYHRIISREISPIRGAQFLQLEHQIALLVDLSIASEMPALTPGATGSSK